MYMAGSVFEPDVMMGFCIMQVMECCWASLEKQVQEAEDLDQIIVAHNDFLKRIAAQCLLDDSNDSKVCIVCL